MLVSTREATVVELLASPATVLARDSVTLVLPQLFRLDLVDSPHRRIKQLKSFLGRQLICCFGLAAHQLNSNALSRRNPLQFIPRPDAVLIRDNLGHSQLQLAGHLWHNPYCIKDTILTARGLLSGRCYVSSAWPTERIFPVAPVVFSRH